jgi:hypothetical protein
MSLYFQRPLPYLECRSTASMVGFREELSSFPTKRFDGGPQTFLPKNAVSMVGAPRRRAFSTCLESSFHVSGNREVV